MDEARRARLAEWLRAAAADPALVITAMERLGGGAIQQNWALDVVCRGAAAAWVLRTDSPARLAISHGRATEFALLRAARAAGVRVPEPLFLCEDPAVIGAPFLVMRRVGGIAAGHRVVRSETLGGGRAACARALGRELARIHAIRPPRADLAALGAPPADPAAAFIAAQRAALDRRGEPRPVLEWGLRALERDPPPPVPIVLCHNDFRTGNVMLDEAGVTAVLDWEFAGWGDPHADLGWFCAACWRFGNTAAEAGGIGPRTAFYQGYAEVAGVAPEHRRVVWWELAAHVRWAMIALDQAERHLSGAEPSLELALTAHLVPGLEWQILAIAAPPADARAEAGARREANPPASAGRALPLGPLQERPAAPELLAIARETLLAELLPRLPEGAVLGARMVANAMAIAARAAAEDRSWTTAVLERMQELTGDAEAPLHAFARAIRAGRFDPGTPRHAEAARLLRDITRARCAVSAPRALAEG